MIYSPVLFLLHAVQQATTIYQAYILLYNMFHFQCRVAKKTTKVTQSPIKATKPLTTTSITSKAKTTSVITTLKYTTTYVHTKITSFLSQSVTSSLETSANEFEATSTVFTSERKLNLVYSTSNMPATSTNTSQIDGKQLSQNNKNLSAQPSWILIGSIIGVGIVALAAVVIAVLVHRRFKAIKEQMLAASVMYDWNDHYKGKCA